MAEIKIVIPDDKAQLVLDAVTFYMRNESEDDKLEVTGAMALTWMKKQLIFEIKRLVKNHQEQDYREKFTFDSPLD